MFGVSVYQLQAAMCQLLLKPSLLAIKGSPSSTVPFM